MTKSHVAFLSVPAYGHMYPTLSVAQELTRRGHRTTYATNESFAEDVRRSGAALLAYPPEMAKTITFDLADNSSTEAVLLACMRFFEQSVLHIDELAARFPADPPDLIAYDPLLLGVATVLGRRWGVPIVATHPNLAFNETYNWPMRSQQEVFSGPNPPQAALDTVELISRMAPLLAEHHIDMNALTTTRELALTFVPREFQPHGDSFTDNHVFVGPALDGAVYQGEWAPPSDGRPVLLVSLGTQFNERPEFFRQCVTAFGDLDWHVVLTLGGREPDPSLGAIPANFEVRPWVPQAAVLKHASALVCNGGIGTVLTALREHTPLVVVPELTEQITIADRVAELGLGRVVPSAELTAEALRRAVLDVAADPRVLARVDEMAGHIDAAGGTARAADAIEARLAAAADLPTTITREDFRYPNLLVGNNQRFVGSPDRVHVARSTNQVVNAVAAAVREGKRVAVRSGGHCFEDFTTSGVRALIDISQMSRVEFDASRSAFMIEAGATLRQVYESLFKGWGVTIPGGNCTGIGLGGHVIGGGNGSLSRSFGTVVDHLYAVEVVVVDADGHARAVVATREPDDPHHDLWWAHTGGGGGNFGVVTRFWMRSPGASGTDPGSLLPRPPGQVLSAQLIWPWAALDEKSFVTILGNHGRWHEENSDPGSPNVALWSVLLSPRRTADPTSVGVIVNVQVDAALPDAQSMIDAHFAQLTAGVDVPPFAPGTAAAPWLDGLTWQGMGGPDNPATRRIKYKGGYLRRSYTDAQLATTHRYLSEPTDAVGFLLLAGYGGRVNAVAPAETALPQRDSVIKAVFCSMWGTEAEDEASLAWIREWYGSVYAETGGVPGIDEISDGCYINYPDVDLADEALNKSGLSWQELYYKDNHARLVRVKSKWDPRGVFHHALSIR